MMEEFIIKETLTFNYLKDEINLTEQDRQEATQLLEEKL